MLEIAQYTVTLKSKDHEISKWYLRLGAPSSPDQYGTVHAVGSGDLHEERLKLKSEFSLNKFRLVERGCAFSGIL